MVQFENISRTQKATKTVSEIELPAAKSFDGAVVSIAKTHTHTMSVQLAESGKFQSQHLLYKICRAEMKLRPQNGILN